MVPPKKNIARTAARKTRPAVIMAEGIQRYIVALTHSGIGTIAQSPSMIAGHRL